MAIPFNWPSEEDTEEYYRRLDQLLADLYDVLRHILLRPRHNVNPQPPRDDEGEDNHDVGGEHLGGEPPEPPGGGGVDGGGEGNENENALEHRLRPLPDLVVNAQSTNNNNQSPSGSRPDQQHQGRSTNRPPSASNSRQPHRRHRNHHRRSSSPKKKPCCALKVSHLLKSSTENWVLVGQELRKIAEEFRMSFKKEEGSKSEEDQGRVEVFKSTSLFSLLVPAPLSGSVWTTVLLLVGWRLLMRNR